MNISISRKFVECIWNKIPLSSCWYDFIENERKNVWRINHINKITTFFLLASQTEFKIRQLHLKNEKEEREREKKMLAINAMSLKYGYKHTKKGNKIRLLKNVNYLMPLRFVHCTRTDSLKYVMYCTYLVGIELGAKRVGYVYLVLRKT